MTQRLNPLTRSMGVSGRDQVAGAPKNARAQSDNKRGPFYLVLIALLFEFGRPQELIPGMGAIPFPSVIDGLIAVAVIVSGKANFAHKQTVLWFSLLILMAVHVPLAVNNFWALMTLKDMVLYFALYLGIITFIDTLAKLRTTVYLWLGIHFLLAIQGIANGGHGITGSWMGDENDFCMELNVAVAFAYFMFMSAKTRLNKIVYLSVMGTLIFTAMTTLSRGGFIGLVAVGLYCWVRSTRKLVALLLVIVLVSFMSLFAPEGYWDEMQTTANETENEYGTGAERLYTWSIGWQMFLSNPLMGVGQSNHPWAFEKYQGDRQFHERSLAGRAAHSLYFTLLPELGLIGAYIFVAMLFYNYRDVRAVEKICGNMQSRSDMGFGQENEALQSAFYLGRAIEGGTVGYLASSVFISTLYYPTFWVLIGFVVALANATKKQQRYQASAPMRPLAATYRAPRPASG